MRLANLEAFQRYAANLERHNILFDDRVARLDVAIDHSALFLSPREYKRCNAFLANYASEGSSDYTTQGGEA
jgi:hypothetical protein